MRISSLDLENYVEKEMATHTNVLAWRIPWKEEPGWLLQSMGSQRVTNNWSDLAHTVHFSPLYDLPHSVGKSEGLPILFQMILFCSLLWLNNISFMHVQHHFIYSLFDEHLGCFHILAIVNSAAMNVAVHISFQIMVFSRYIPRSVITGSYF